MQHGKNVKKEFEMNKKTAILVIVAIVAAVLTVFVLRNVPQGEAETAAIDIIEEVPSLAGNWNDWAGTEFRFDNGNWESWFWDTVGTRGTYTADNSEITMYLTDVFDGSEWTSYAEEPKTGTYTISGDILVLTFDNETRSFTRR